MNHLKILVAGAAALALTSGVAFAADSMSADHMKMSKMQMKTMKSCQAMDHDAMMKAAKCKKMMAAHPDMFNADGTMKSDMAPH